MGFSDGTDLQHTFLWRNQKKSICLDTHAYLELRKAWHLSIYSQPSLYRHSILLRKHAYSNTLKILPPKNDKFSDKIF